MAAIATAMISASNTSCPMPIPGTREDRAVRRAAEGAGEGRGSIARAVAIPSRARDMAERFMTSHCGVDNATRQYGVGTRVKS